MFVRFRQSARRLQLRLVETRRDGSKVRHEHVASLGAVPVPAQVADRVEFWRRLFERLWRLSNHLDDALQAKILGVVHARVPMPAQVRPTAVAEGKPFEGRHRGAAAAVPAAEREWAGTSRS